MTVVYHFNPGTGRRALCQASVRECPLVHGSSPEEAMKNYETLMNESNEVLAGVKKHRSAVKEIEEGFAKNSPNASSSPRRTPLKALQADELAKVLLVETSDLGMDVEKIHNSVQLATILHHGQTRGPRYHNGEFKAKVPYIEHPLRNSLRLVRLGVKDQDIIIASVLHDTVEDGAQNYVNKFLNNKEEMEENEARKLLSARIEQQYGEKVASTVQAVTNEHVPLKKLGALSMQERRDIYRDHVDENIRNNPAAYMVKISDFIDNATGLYHNDIAGSEKGIIKRALKYKPVVDVFRKRMAEMELPVSKEDIKVIQGQLDRTEYRLSDLIEKYNHLVKN